jgi:hypothetical protein
MRRLAIQSTPIRTQNTPIITYTLASTPNVSAGVNSTNRNKTTPIEYVAKTTSTNNETGTQMATQNATYTPPCTKSALQPERARATSIIHSKSSNSTTLQRKLYDKADANNQHNIVKGNTKRIATGIDNSTIMQINQSPRTTIRNTRTIINNAPEAKNDLLQATSAPRATMSKPHSHLSEIQIDKQG